MTGPPLTSRTNPRVKDVVALHQRRHRDERGLYVVEGPHAVDAALAAGVVEEVFATAPLVERYAGDAAVTEVADGVLAKLATSKSPQGVVAVARKRLADLAAVTGRGFVIVCDRIADPGNAGAVIRTGDAFAAAGVVFTAGSVDPYNPKSARASTGSLTHLPVVADVTLAQVVAACRDRGQRVLGLAATAPASIEEAGVLTPPVALVFGSEAHGLSPEADMDAVVAIPQDGQAESLNLAAAVAVASYAVARAVRRGSS